MAFVNEIVPQEDIEKYGLVELHRHYSRLAGNNNAARRGLDGKDTWIVDREREIWLMPLGVVIVEDEPSAMPSGDVYYILHYKDQNIEVMIFSNRKEGSTKFTDNPFRIRWEILSITPESFDDVTTQELIDVITEAMIARGDKSIEKFVTNLDIQVKYVGGDH